MRVALLLAAVAALWVQPATSRAADIALPQLGTQERYLLTISGLRQSDEVSIEGRFDGLLAMMWWEQFVPGTWTFWGNEDFTNLSCYNDTGVANHCQSEITGDPSAFMSLDSARYATSQKTWFTFGWDDHIDRPDCLAIPEADRVNQAICGIDWADARASLNFDVLWDGQGEPPDWTYALERISAVPEPAAWAMMILGVGLIGFTMRQRRHQFVQLPEVSKGP